MNWQEHLDRWTDAGLIDAEAAERIRAFEAKQPNLFRVCGPQVLALVFGGVLVAAGVFLFIESRWDWMSPSARLATLIAVVAVIHIGAAFSGKFPALQITLHAVGTAALGGAIIRQMLYQGEDWALAMFLWALGAWVGAWVLRDFVQFAFAAVLTPVWILFWAYHANPDSAPWIAAFLTLVALVYLGANRAAEMSMWRNTLAAIGAAAVLPCAIATVLMAGDATSSAWTLVLLPIPVAIVLRKLAGWPVIAWIAWVVFQMAAADGDIVVVKYLLAGAASVGLAVWGVVEVRKERVNLGFAGFVITIGVFYFHYAADKLDRSLGLIVLGTVFLAGGWQLERFRRALMKRLEPEVRPA